MPISPAIKVGAKRSSGFTLVELIVVCLVLTLIAAAIVPNLVAVTRSRSIKDIEANIARLPSEARNAALKTQTPVRIRLSGTQLVMEQAPATGSAQQIKQIDLGTDIQVDRVELNGKPSEAGTWEWMVYPDGSADSGGIQFSEGQLQRALILSTTGDARWITGELPDTSQDQWPAGQLQQRT